MALKVKQNALEFSITDVFSNRISLYTFKGKKVYVAFMRFAGGPVYNLRVHTLLKHADTFKAKNIEVVFVYESSIANMRMYLEDTSYPFTFVADPENTLYNSYRVKRSWKKFLASMFKGMIGKASAGDKLFKKKPELDGKLNPMEAEFLIDESGKLAIAHYSAFLGDDLPIEKIVNG